MRDTISVSTAITLELGMLLVFIHQRSVLGVVLWLAYTYFSATRLLFTKEEE